MSLPPNPGLQRLRRQGLTSDGDVEALEAVAARYAVAITPSSAALIDRQDPSDPIAAQFLPDVRELIEDRLERSDPIGDAAHAPVRGLVHRYPDRVLLMPTMLCASYCRFCFRREQVGSQDDGMLPTDDLARALDYIAAHPEIWEVILTGGDPLVLSDRRLARLMAALEGIDHVKVVRLHTRVPAVSPERVTSALAQALRSTRKAVFVALHANHPREMTSEVRAACAKLIDVGVPMVSQSVLLKGVNDDVVTLTALMRAFVETRIKPYYLHIGDLAPGTSHLRVGLRDAQALSKRLRGHVSGLCQPTLVLDIPGGAGKVPVGSPFAKEAGPDSWRVEDPWGHVHAYPAAAPQRSSDLDVQ